MASDAEMEDLRVVLDYLPCNSCEKTVPERERRYLCTICGRLNRTVSAELTVPRWKMEDKEVVPLEGREIDELKPTISIEEKKKEKKEEEKEILEILEVGVEIPEEEIEVEEEIPEWEAIEDEAFRKGEYTLYTKEVIMRGGRKQRIYFFSKKGRDDAMPCAKPEGYKVKIIKKTGLPVLKKK
jgi:hypothetical protein